MSLVIKSSTTIGLLSGLVLPPLVMKFILEPRIVQIKYDEIRNIKYNIEYLGWHVRGLEEAKGFEEDNVYVPVSLLSGQTYEG